MGTDFKFDNIVFKFQLKNTQIRHFWSQIKGILFLHQTLQQDKFEEAGFKCDNSIFKFEPKYMQIRGIFGPKFKDFHFAPNFAIRQI